MLYTTLCGFDLLVQEKTTPITVCLQEEREFVDADEIEESEVSDIEDLQTNIEEELFEKKLTPARRRKLEIEYEYEEAGPSRSKAKS